MSQSVIVFTNAAWGYVLAIFISCSNCATTRRLFQIRKFFWMFHFLWLLLDGRCVNPPTTDHATDHRPLTTDHRPICTDHRPPTSNIIYRPELFFFLRYNLQTRKKKTFFLESTLLYIKHFLIFYCLQF